MEKQHLTYFKIENFKRFDSFEMDNLGQFNLIVGDNNVGKTSVLEALTFDEDIVKISTNFFTNFTHRLIFSFKDGKIKDTEVIKTHFWDFIFKDVYKPITINVQGEANINMRLELKANSELNNIEREYARKEIIKFIPSIWIKQTFQDYDEFNNFHLMGAYFEDVNVGDLYDWYSPFIPANTQYNQELVNFFYKYFNNNKEVRKEFEGNLKQFIPNLEEVRTHKFFENQETLSVTLIDSNFIYPIRQFGDGTVKVAGLLLEIFITQNKRLMVDEIGAGIHFTRLKGYWRTIIQLCSKYNVQLFATTHSLECQRAFVDALEDEDMKQFQADARNITLLENKHGDVKAFTYNFDEFEFSLANGINTRGGER